MYRSAYNNIIIRAILLLMGYGFISPITANANQREISSIDSIAYVSMKYNKIMNGLENNQQIKMELCLRSSDLCKKEKRLRNGEEAFYVYANVYENGGFVIVSADDRMPEILAYSCSGTFQLENIPASARYWLECYLDNYMNLEMGSPISDASYLLLTEVNPEGVTPILGNLPWGQGAPYNDLCPQSSIGKCVTGCVATAMSQVMWLHQYPECGRGNISYFTRTHHIQVDMNLAEHPFKWNLIKEEYQKGKYTEDEANAVATLMAACGAAVHMDYAPDGSGAYQYDILKALVSNFGYDPDAAFLPREYFDTTDWHNLLISELNEGRAVNYAGQSRTDGGHSFVIDGYEINSNVEYPYYHLNWGWEGMCNGYYLLPQLTPAQQGTPYVDEGFNEGQQMLIGVHPDDGQINANRLYAESLKVMQAILKPGETTTVKISDITNLCYRTFHGYIALQLCDSLGNMFVFGEAQIEPISYFESQHDLTIQFVVPDTLPEGKYFVKLISVNSGGEIAEIYSHSSPHIIISYNPYGEVKDEDTLLCSSEFEIFKQNNIDDYINLRIYELFNYSNDLLDGYIQMEIASEDGTSITTIGNSVWMPALDSQEVTSSPITLLGTIPSELSYGHYRLYVLFYPSGQSTSNRIKFFERTNPIYKPIEYFLPMDVYECEAIINGISFPRVSTTIRNRAISSLQKEHYFNLQGIRQVGKPSQKGLYIINRGCKVININTQ